MTVPSKSLKDLFLSALEVPTDDRIEWLDRECGRDAALREQLNLMLAAHDAPHSLLDQPSKVELGATLDQPITEKPGAEIGPYKLLQLVGEGGMGSVWMAEQHEPVRRRVALKLIKPGMDSRQVLARFDAERQALSLMDHPNIAKVLDAGTTASGRPYFVMELVKGQPITQYCDEQRLTPRQRVELFLPVCHAIQHAHQKGIIHRDIKPSNVLVAEYDGRPVAKVIDFGVAKAIHQPLTEKTMFTGLGQIIGTLEYMSPEQARVNQLDVDTRSDVYSLGVLLYELLTGGTPFDKQRLKNAALDELLRIIREEEPPRPSTRLSSSQTLPSIAANRRTDSTRLSTLVRGELDWIVMKALEKDRNRRYETANGFAMDIQRYLNDEAVLACPPSLGYRLRKFSRRNKPALSVASLVLLSLVLLGTGIGWTMRDRAERQERVVAQVKVILKEVDELQHEQKWPEALAAARRAEAAVKGSETDPETTERVNALLNDLELIDRLEQIRMRQSAWIGRSFDYSGTASEYARAFRDYGVDVDDLAIEVSIERLKARPEICIPVAAALDQLISVRRKLEAGAVSNRLRTIASAIDPDPLRSRLRATWGQPATAVANELRQLAESIDIRAQHPMTLVTLAETLKRAKQTEAAIRLLRCARAVHPGDFWLNFHLAHALAHEHDDEGAIRFYTAAEAIRPQSVATINNLGNVLRDQKKLDESVDCYRRAIEIDPQFARGYQNLGVTLCYQGKWDEAVAACYKAIELDQSDAPAYMNLGFVLKSQKKSTDSVAAHRKAVELDPEFALAYSHLGAALRDQGHLDEATAAHRKAIELDPDADYNYYDLGLDLSAQGKPDDAIASLRKAIELNPKHRGALQEIGQILNKQGKLPEAAHAYREAIELNPTDSVSHNNLGAIYAVQGKADEAIAAFREAIEADPQGVTAYHNLAAALDRGKKHEEAIAVYRSAIKVDPQSVHAYIELGKLLTDHSKSYGGAIECFQKAIELEPENAWACYASLARLLRSAGRDAEAREVDQRLAVLNQTKWDRELADLSFAVERFPGSPNALAARAHWLQNHGRFSESDSDHVRLLELMPSEHWFWYHRACLLAYLAREQQYQEHCRAMVSRFAGATDFAVLERITKGALLLPVLGGERESLARQAERAFQLAPESPWSTLLRGLAEYRAGRFEQAADWLQECRTAPCDDHGGYARVVAASAYTALVRHHMGQESEAQEVLELASRQAAHDLRAFDSGELNHDGVENWLIAQIALREATSVITGQKLSAPQQVTGVHVQHAPMLALVASPYGGQAREIPGVLQAEDFDEGGEGLAYHDTTYQDGGAQASLPRYRSESVDIDDCADIGGGFNVGGILPGEWLSYTVEVAETDTYEVDIRSCSPSGGLLHMEIGGRDVSGPLEIPAVGWGKWTTVTAKGVRLKSGMQTLRIVFDAADTNPHVCNLNWIELREAISHEAPQGSRLDDSSGGTFREEADRQVK